MTFKFEMLDVWKRAVGFALNIYKETNNFPKEEIYGITSQKRRASISIAVNIAEGEGRYNNKDFIRFIRVAKGSLNETVTLLLICRRLGYISEDRYDSLYGECGEISRMQYGLLKSLD